MSYLWFLIDTMLRPFYFAEHRIGSYSPFRSVVFFMLTITFSRLLISSRDLYHLQRLTNFYSSLSDLVVTIPLFTGGLFVFSGVLFLIARIIKTKARFKNSLMASALSCSPLLFSTVPYLKQAVYIWMFLLVVLFLQQLQRIAFLSAFLAALMAALSLLLLGFVFGVIQF